MKNNLLFLVGILAGTISAFCVLYTIWDLNKPERLPYDTIYETGYYEGYDDGLRRASLPYQNIFEYGKSPARDKDTYEIMNYLIFWEMPEKGVRSLIEYAVEDSTKVDSFMRYYEKQLKIEISKHD